MTNPVSGAVEAVANFAARAPIGTACVYYPVRPFKLADAVWTRIRSEPWALGHGQVVVKIEARVGGVAIEHIFPVITAIVEK